MNRRAPILAAVVIFIGVATVVRSRGMLTGSPTPADVTADTSILVALENDWAEAVVKRDDAFFRRTLAPGFVYSEDGRTISRDDLLRDLTTGTDTVENAHNDEMKMHSFGTTVVVTGWLAMRGRGAQGPFDRRYRFTDTWIKRDGVWQIVAAHDYLVPEKTP